ncbi:MULTISPECIES: hypothetical protein [Streptosporangium]|uniref:FXSXX-COOH protein n=1 Tax=Streptosporangium longisporum TaxID=46187 RepID=A0ABN3Y997_9ACTN
MARKADGKDAGHVNGRLVDVTGLTLADLDRIEGSPLKDALRHILDDDDMGPVAGFSSVVRKPGTSALPK